MHALFQWLIDGVSGAGYLGIAVLMAIESSVLPLPSELIMPPAGYLAARGQMNPWIAIAAGTVGSIVGALINYALAVFLGLPALKRYGRYVLVSERSLDRAQVFFNRHGEIGTLLGRLVPVVRHLISIPAGICRMALGRFILFTGVGAGIWCAVLVYIGWIVGLQTATLDQAMVQTYTHRAVIAVIAAVAVAVAGYVVWRRAQRRRGAPRDAERLDADA